MWHHMLKFSFCIIFDNLVKNMIKDNPNSNCVNINNNIGFSSCLPEVTVCLLCNELYRYIYIQTVHATENTSARQYTHQRY